MKNFRKIFVSTASISLIGGLLTCAHADCEVLGNNVNAFLAAYETLQKQLADADAGSIEINLDRTALHDLKMGTPDCIQKSLKCLAKYAMAQVTGRKHIKGAENISQEAKEEIFKLMTTHEEDSMKNRDLIQKDFDDQDSNLKKRLEKKRQTRLQTAKQSQVHSGKDSPKIHRQNGYAQQLEEVAQKLKQLQQQQHDDEEYNLLQDINN